MEPSMTLMPPKPGTCPVCATDHPETHPHNAQSMYYQYRFYGLRGRWPTWADAVAHCDEQIRTHCETFLRERGHWTEPDGEDPIGDPPGESIAQMTDMNEHRANEDDDGNDE